MDTPTPIIGYDVTRSGKTEYIPADSLDKTEENPPQYVFRKGGKVVKEIFVHALDNPPKPKFARTPEKEAKLRESYRKGGAANEMPPDLKR